MKIYFYNSIDDDEFEKDPNRTIIADRSISLLWLSKHISQFKQTTNDPEIIRVPVTIKMEE